MTHRVALITGAGRRIGAEIAEHLHQAGYRVILHYKQSANEAVQLAQHFNSQTPDSAACLQADLCDIQQVQQLGQSAVSLWGRVDLLVNNASSFYPTPLSTANEDQWDELIASNLKGPFFLVQALAESLKQNRGCVVNIADIHGERPLADHSIYSIAKAGNLMLTKTLALELAPDVRVNGIAPGAMLWPEGDDGEPQPNPQMVERTPLKSLGGAQNLARALLFLAEENNYITGHILTVDGGRSLRQ